MPERSVYSTASYKENSFLKELVSLKCTKWQKAKGSWCLRDQDWALPVCISVSANRGKCYWSFCAIKLLLPCPLHPTIGILGLLGRRAVAVPSCQISTFLRRGWGGRGRGCSEWARDHEADLWDASGQRKRLCRKKKKIPTTFLH